MMKCPACDSSMTETQVYRFGAGARGAWALITLVAAAGASLSLRTMLPTGDEGFVLLIAGTLGLLVICSGPALLVWSSVDAWACIACGHWINRTTPPTPTRSSIESAREKSDGPRLPAGRM